MEYGLIGEKLGHSYSVEVHRQIGDYDYVLREIPRSDLGAFMEGKGFKAINVTIPYKQDVIPYLDSIDEAAKAIGAVNTIVNRDGHLFGYNTDFHGLSRLITSLKLNLKGKKVLILGSGGTSKTSLAVSKHLGARDILVVSRRESEGTISYEEAYKSHADAQIIINATPNGMYPNIDSSPIDLEPFKNLEGVVDVIYNPLRSMLVLDAQRRGLKACGGLYMLVLQAIVAAERFFDCTIDEEKADSIFKSILHSKENIVLVGMPGCGKSTIGELLAKKLDRELVDTDQMIQAKTGRHPSEIIREQGEKAFRDIESEVCKELSSKTGIIIATGGGAILRDENVMHLKNNGVLFFLDRALEHILPTDDRPLSSSRDKLIEVYNSRYDRYCSCCDHHIKTDENESNTVNSIMEAWS